MAQDHPIQNKLARVESVLWGQVAGTDEGWPDDVPWADFAEAMRQGPEVVFTGLVRVKSVHPGSVFLTTVLWERQADYMLTRRIPAKLEPIGAEGDLARRFRLNIDRGWIRNELESRSGLQTGGRVELTIRGQMVRDRCGNFLDAVPLSYAPTSPPHSRPGDDFIALLRFAAETRAPLPPQEPEAEAW